MNIEKGYLFITDITGYTQFLTRSELDHAKEILEALFDSILKHLHPPIIMDIVKLRAWLYPCIRVTFAGVCIQPEKLKEIESKKGEPLRSEGSKGRFAQLAGKNS